MKFARAVVFLSVVVSLGASQAKTEDGGDVLKGEWSFVSMKMGGRLAPADLLKGLTATFDGQTYTHKTNDQVVEQGTYQVDTAKTPWTIDFAIAKGPEAGKRQLGLVAVEGQTLTLRVADAGSTQRPTSLEPKADSSAIVVVMKRIKP